MNTEKDIELKKLSIEEKVARINFLTAEIDLKYIEIKKLSKGLDYLREQRPELDKHFQNLKNKKYAKT